MGPGNGEQHGAAWLAFAVAGVAARPADAAARLLDVPVLERGVHLLDRALGIASRGGVRLTPAALRALAEETADTSFAKAAESLGGWPGWR